MAETLKYLEVRVGSKFTQHHENSLCGRIDEYDYVKYELVCLKSLIGDVVSVQRYKDVYRKAKKHHWLTLCEIVIIGKKASD